MKPLCTLVLIGSLLLAGAHPIQAQIRFGPGSTDPGERLDTIVAVVDNDVITQAELNRSLVDARRQIQSRGVDPPPPQVLERQVLERLIVDRLLERAATRAGIVVDDPTLNAAVESIARQNDMTLSQLRTAVERDGTNFAAFREDIRKQVEAQRLRQQVIDPRLTVTEQEIDNALRRTDLGVAAAGETQRAAVREALLRRKAEEEWDLWLRQLRDQAYVEIRLQ